jgi:signal peptidase I
MRTNSQKRTKNIPSFISAPLMVFGCLLVVFLFHRYLGFLVIVDGRSMCPTLQPKTMLFVRSMAPGSILHRGDIAVLDDGEGSVIKRIVGLPGDEVHFVRGAVFINGRQMSEPYLPKGIVTYPEDVGDEIRVGSNQYLVLGDNRQKSQDGRSYGPVNAEQIRGLLPYDGPAPMFGSLDFAAVRLGPGLVR